MRDHLSKYRISHLVVAGEAAKNLRSFAIESNQHLPHFCTQRQYPHLQPPANKNNLRESAESFRNQHSVKQIRTKIHIPISMFRMVLIPAVLVLAVHGKGSKSRKKKKDHRRSAHALRRIAERMLLPEDQDDLPAHSSLVESSRHSDRSRIHQQIWNTLRREAGRVQEEHAEEAVTEPVDENRSDPVGETAMLPIEEERAMWLPNQASASDPSGENSPDPTSNGRALSNLCASLVPQNEVHSLEKEEDEHRQQIADSRQQLEKRMKEVSALSREKALYAHEASGDESADVVTDKMAKMERILGKDQTEHSARIRARNERFNALMSGSNPIDIGHDELKAVYQSREEIDKIQEEITRRACPLDKNLFLLANEHIFGGSGPEESIYIGTCDWINNPRSACARSLREKAQTEFTCQQYNRIIEINLSEDKKLQKVINVFGGMLANIEQEHYKDPYWMLAKYVRNMFQCNKVEEVHLAKLSTNDKKYMINMDDKKLSGQFAVKIGDMVGSRHDCAPKAIMFKVIADFFKMPCRVVTTSDHAWNLGLDQDGKWQRMDVAQLNFQGMAMSNSVDSPSMPLPATSVFDYSTASGSEGILDTHDEEQAVVDETKRRAIPISVPDFLEQIKHAQVLEELEEFLLRNDKSLHSQFFMTVRPILKEFHGIECALKVVGDNDQKRDLQAQHVKALTQVRQALDYFIVLCLDDDKMYKLYQPLVSWLKSDADRKLYLQSIEKLVSNRGKKYQGLRQQVIGRCMRAIRSA